MAEGKVQTVFLETDRSTAFVVVPQSPPQHPAPTIVPIPDATATKARATFSENEGGQSASAPAYRTSTKPSTAPALSDGASTSRADDASSLRVHPSVLGVSTLARSPGATGATAAEQMAAIAASDQGSRSSHNSTRPQSASQKVLKAISDLLSRSLPVILLGIVAYIYYVFVFRVCIRYYINRKDDQTLATIYLCVFNVLVFLFLVSYARSLARSPGTALKPPVRKPPPPVPALTTPYEPQRTHSNLSQASLVSRSSHSRTPSNAPPVHPAAAGLNPAYPSYQSTAPCVSHDTTAVSSPLDPVAPKLDHMDVVISMANDGAQTLLPAMNGNGANAVVAEVSGDADSAPQPADSPTSNQSGDDASPVATLSVCKRDGRPRWCDICKIVKPDRCHHCSECDQCVLRMDHHCPWINGCVGYNNHKFFYLFIFYGSLAAVFVFCTMISLLISVVRANSHRSREREWQNNMSSNSTATASGAEWWTTRWNITQHEQWLEDCRERDALLDAFDVQWVIVCILSFLFALLLVSFTATHTVYILTNRTTIESLQDVRATFIKVLYRRSPTEAFLNSLDQSSHFFVNQERLVGMPLLLPSNMHGPSSRILFNVVMLEPGERLWNRGSWLANWNSIMGPAWWLWFVPYGNTPGDGIHDVYNEDVYRRLVSDALAQARLQLANIGVLGDNGIGKGPWPGRGGGYGTYGSHSRRHSKARDRGNHYHSGGSSKQGSSNNSRTGQIGAPQGGGRGVTGEGSVSTGHCADSYTRQQPTREKRTADRDGATNLPIDTPHRPNIHSASEPASVNPSRSPSPDGRADRAAAGSRKTLKRMGTAPSTLMPSTVRFQNDQDNIPTARQRAETYGATPSGWAVAEASHPSQSYLVPPPTKPVPPGPRRHARQRTLSSNRSQGGGSSIGRGPGGGNEFSSGGFGLGIDGDGIAVNSSTLLRLTTEDQRSAGGRSSPSSSGRKGHRRHHSARGSSDPHHHHHHSHHNHHHHHHTQHQPIPAHPRTTARILAAPPISPDSDDAFQPPVLSPTMPRNVGPSSELPRTLPRSQSHDPQQSIAPLVHRSPDGDSQDSKSKGKAVMESKTYIGRQRHRTVDVMITTNTVAEQEDVAVGVSPSDVGSEPSLDQPFLTPSASPIDEPSPLHLPYFEPSKSTILPTHSQQEQHQSQLVL